MYNIFNYKILNLLCIISFITFSCIPNEYLNADYVKRLLMCYFALDAYNNYLDIVLHHLLYYFVTIYEDFALVHKCLIMEWSTLFLLLYKEKYPTKYLFACSWVSIRLMYIPYYFYCIQSELDILSKNIVILIYGFHFHWTCKIMNKGLDTSYGLSSLLLMGVPLNMMYYVVPMDSHTYCMIYMQTQISFYFNVLRLQNNHNRLYLTLYALDTTMITYICLTYLNLPYKMILGVTHFLIKYNYPSAYIHKCIFLFSFLHLANRYSELWYISLVPIYLTQFKMNRLHYPTIYNYLWHGCSGLLISYTLKNRILPTCIFSTSLCTPATYTAYAATTTAVSAAFASTNG